LCLAKYPDSRRCLRLLQLILENPGLSERLFEVLQPGRLKETDRLPQSDRMKETA
jgi:hypothetical protein